MSISTVIKTMQDIMRKDAGVDGDAQRIGQISWLLFLKIFDASEQALQAENINHIPAIDEKYLWSSWAADTQGMTGEVLLDFINNDLFPELKELSATINTNPRGYLVKQAFGDAYNYMKNGTLLRQVINKLNEVDFNKSKDKHLFGDIYEQILKDLQSAGNAGEFYTPRAVTEFIVQMINPKLGETILDPACGTGGFLVNAVASLKKQQKTTDDLTLLQQSIHGIEKKQLPHLLCVTNLMLHDIEQPTTIRHANTLATSLSNLTAKDEVDIIITNPPFGGSEEDGIEKNFPADLRTKETADLFLIYIMEILKTKGRAAVVLPDGTLFGEGVQTRIKQKLLEKCNLHTLVRLPNSVFAPYTSIKTNILFFEKGSATKKVWYYEVPLPVGVKAFNKTKPMQLTAFADCIKWWGAGDTAAATVKRQQREANQYAWQVSIEDIKKRDYNLDIKNPHIVEQQNHDPKQLLTDYQQQQQQINNFQRQLKDILNNALVGAE